MSCIPAKDRKLYMIEVVNIGDLFGYLVGGKNRCDNSAETGAALISIYETKYGSDKLLVFFII